MAQHDQIVDNGPGLAVRSDFNAAIAALFSSSSGTVEPAVKVPGQLWYDTSVAGPPVLKIRDQANTAWVQLQVVATGADFTTSGNVIIAKAAVANDLRLRGQVATKDRWTVALGNTTAEGGSNAGSDFTLSRYDDTGTLIDAPFSVIRSTGKATFAKTVAVTASAIPTNENQAHLYASIVDAVGGLIGFNAYNSLISSTSGWSPNANGYGAVIGFTTATGVLQFYTTDSKTVGTQFALTSKLQIQPTVTYSYSPLMAADSATPSRVGCYSAAYASAFVWTIDGAGRQALYASDAAGAQSGTATLVVNRSQGLQAIGPAADMSFYDNGSSSRILALDSTNFMYRNANNMIWVQNNSQTLSILVNGNMDLIGSTASKIVAGSWAARSDARIKTAIRDYTSGLEEILKLRPRWFKFRPETHLEEMPEDHIGLVAQEAQAAMPELVTVRDDEVGEIHLPDMRTLDPTAITYALVNSCKELVARLQTAEARIAALEAGR